MLSIPYTITKPEVFSWGLDIRAGFLSLLDLPHKEYCRLTYSNLDLAKLSYTLPNDAHLRTIMRRYANQGRAGDIFVGVVLVLSKQLRKSGRVDSRLWSLLPRLARHEMHVRIKFCLHEEERKSPEVEEEWQMRPFPEFVWWKSLPDWVEPYLRRLKAETGRKWILSESRISKITGECQREYEPLIQALETADTNKTRRQLITSWLQPR